MLRSTEEEEKVQKKVPLSLEELLAKKKAEEEALSKVSIATVAMSELNLYDKNVMFLHHIHSGLSFICCFSFLAFIKGFLISW